jgi:hypothetical protein
MTSLLCGRNPTDQVGAASPFAKIVAFGYEDGPSIGIVRCVDCSEAYRFEMLATDVDGLYDQAAWDRGEELRIFALVPLSEGAFDRIVTLLSSVEEPIWPVWLPGVSRRSPELDRHIEADVSEILGTAGHPRLIVATADLLKPFVAIRDYPAEDGQAPLDWFAVLGFASGGQLVATR